MIFSGSTLHAGSGKTYTGNILNQPLFHAKLDYAHIRIINGRWWAPEDEVLSTPGVVEAFEQAIQDSEDRKCSL